MKVLNNDITQPDENRGLQKYSEWNSDRFVSNYSCSLKDDFYIKREAYSNGTAFYSYEVQS